jgi:SecD/SecF fusion protein
MFALRKSDKLDVGQGLEKLNNPKIDVMGKRKAFMGVSAVLIVLSFGSMFVKGFEQGIDFKGGRVYTVSVADKAVNAQKIEAAIVANAAQLGTPIVKNSEEFFMISLPREEGVNARAGVEASLKSLGKYEIVNEEEVGPTIGAKLKIDAAWAMFWSILMIVMYIWFRFGRHGLGFGVGALAALVHDVILTLGFISLLGIELDVTVIAALLTIIGYSVNDSIVVFDRIRERTQVMGKETFSERVNLAINQTMSRTFNTALTVFLTVLALVFFGGHTVHGFSMSMLIGLIVGTYSSVFVASPIVVWWANRRPSKS